MKSGSFSGNSDAWAQSEHDLLLTWYGNVPDRKRFRFYPGLLDSKEKAGRRM